MDIENEIFKRTRIKIDTLIPYGFTKSENVYNYSKIFMNSFKADIVINEQGVVKGKVYDLNVGDEYLNFRIENSVGEFVNSVREEYKSILKDIRKHCFEKLYFMTEQANRITMMNQSLLGKNFLDMEFLEIQITKNGMDLF